MHCEKGEKAIFEKQTCSILRELSELWEKERKLFVEIEDLTIVFSYMAATNFPNRSVENAPYSHFPLVFFTTFQKLDGNTDAQVSWIGDISSFYSMVCSHSDSFSKMSNTTASSGLKPVWGNINVQIQHFHSLCSTLKAGSQANFLSILQSPPSSIRHHTCTTPFLFLRQLLRLFLRLSFVQGFLTAWSFR